MILIISSSTDLQAQAVFEQLKTLNAPVLFLDFAKSPPSYGITAGFDRKTNHQTFELLYDGKKIDLADARVVWWRSPIPSSFTMADSAWADILTALDLFWFNRPGNVDEAERMVFQLRTARVLDLRLPDTCMTADLSIARDFIKKHGRENVFLRTFSKADRKWSETVLPQGEDEIINSENKGPIIIQERIAGEDLKITILNDTFNADFDGPKIFVEKWECWTDLLKKFVRHLGVRYGTVNLRRTPEGEVIFLDFNPLGEWSSIKEKTRSDVTKKIAAFLKKRDEKAIHGPLGEIALSLSGGGYRASAFHLGTMQMLYELGVLDDVTRLSTASGGTITAAKYLFEMGKVRKPSFKQFSDEMKNFLRKKNVITEAINRLDKTSHVNGEDLMPSLSRAAADVYADPKLVGKTTLGWLRASDRKIREIAFNATEFHTATNFRFRISDNTRIKSGNDTAKIDNVEADKLRLADIIAASACFPGGLEPIYFPSDFVWDQPLEQVRKNLGPGFEKDDIPLMDGGVFDNQAIDSIKSSLERKDGSTGLFIISDSSARNSRMLDRKPVLKKSMLKLWLVAVFVALFLLAALSPVATISYGIFKRIWFGEWDGALFLYNILPFFVALIIGALAIVVMSKILPSWPLVKEKIGPNGWGSLARLNVFEMIELVWSRITSVLSLVLDVFMRRIRSTGFNSVFSDGNLNQSLLTNLIYDIDDSSRWKNKIPQDLFPIRDIRKLVKKAEKYPTTLDFDGKNAECLNELITAGRSTMCFNILRYLYQFKSAEIRTQGSPLQDLARRVEDKWRKCNEPRPGKEKFSLATIKSRTPKGAVSVKSTSPAKSRSGTVARAPQTRRERYPMPDAILEALEKEGLFDAYNERPPYQQNDYIGWITRAQREETGQKRLHQMLDELRRGDVYMKMKWKSKG